MNSFVSTPSPRVTIFIPVYNAADFIYETISSALNQTYEDFEVLIVDDGSTDNSVKIIEEFGDNRIRVVRNNTNMGRPYTRNLGIELAKGEFLAVLDADDIAMPERISRQVEFLDQHPDIVAVGTSAYYIDNFEKNEILCEVITDSDDISTRIFQTNCFIHSSAMFRKNILVDIGGYNLEYPQAQDYELFLRLCEHYKLTNINKPLVKYRIHSNQVSQTKLASQRRLANIARLNTYRRQFLNGNLPTGAIEPRVSFFDKLFAKNGTLGSDFLFWIKLYRQLRQHKSADSLIFPALLAAPLSAEIYKEIYFCILRSSLANKIRWYLKRLN
ncbi:glycosyltransferase [Methylomonas sp. LL1]|uniref:glycosyltransferase family 2 protein n=1 Tax=Methylomonas sp. LL1 TaxID=2785785 RepID=UPI0018C41242|nr:glycosyltransferase [Methylomonas sp. LL1]QPK65310.1 glycosyltransferase [Methylomonas sp. LL1]